MRITHDLAKYKPSLKPRPDLFWVGAKFGLAFVVILVKTFAYTKSSRFVPKFYFHTF